jgi:hypothetical protein
VNPDGSASNLVSAGLVGPITGIEVSKYRFGVASASNTAPIMAVIPNFTVNDGNLLTFAAVAADADVPAQTLRFSLDPSHPPEASITDSGQFTWTPIRAPATNVFTVRVTDNGTPSLSATVSFTVTINHLPVPASPLLARPPGQGLKVRGLALLGSDPDGDELFLSAVSPASAQGGVVGTNQDWVFYTPPVGFTNPDVIGYAVADGRGGFSAGRVNIICVTNPAASLNLTWTTSPARQVHMRGDGIPHVSYSLEFSERLTNPVWQYLGIVKADAFGVFEYSDHPPAGAPARFYRASCP